MRRRAQRSQSDPLALKVGNGVDAFLGEQLDAARHPAGQDRYRLAGIDPNDIRRRKVEAEIRLTGPYRVRGLSGRPRIDIADIGKTFGAEELLGHVYRGAAKSRCSREAQSRCFKGGPFGAQYSRRADE